MRNLIAAVYFLLGLFGCQIGSTTTVTRSVIDGVDVIHSRTRTMAGIARFECIASSSGECHYTLFPSRCASSQDGCTRPVERFVMSTGETREVVGLPTFRACVTREEAALTPDCAPATGSSPQGRSE